MTLFFDSDVAQKYGLKEAIILSHIAYWVAKNEANEKHFHDGRYWTYNSVNAFAKMFPFMTPKQTRTALDSLKEQGLIVTGNYNTNVLDRTMWYALTDLGSTICREGLTHLPQRADTFAQEGECIYKIQQSNNNKDIYGDFEKFWEAYPKKINKKDAMKAFQKVKENVDVLVKAVNEQKNSQQWTKNGGQFIPYPATWLRGEQWQNKLEASKESNNSDEPSELFKQILGEIRT